MAISSHDKIQEAIAKMDFDTPYIVIVGDSLNGSRTIKGLLRTKRMMVSEHATWHREPDSKTRKIVRQEWYDTIDLTYDKKIPVSAILSITEEKVKK